MENNKELNRMKVVLAEKKRSNLWPSKQLGCVPTTVSKWLYELITTSIGAADESRKIV